MKTQHKWFACVSFSNIMDPDIWCCSQEMVFTKLRVKKAGRSCREMKTSTLWQSLASKKLLSAKCNNSKCTIEKEWLNCDCVGNQEISFILASMVLHTIVWSTICVADSPLTVKYLKYMDSARHANAQLMRWLMFLQRYSFKVEAINLTIFLFPFLLKRGLCWEKLSSVTSVTLHDYSQIVYFRSSVSVLLLDLFERSRTRLRI